MTTLQKYVDNGEILLTDESSYINAEAFRNVVVVLWNRVDKGCGICNFTSPSVYQSAMATAQFGNVALPQLLKLYLHNRQVYRCEAYLFGGASLGDNDIIGFENLRMAKKILDSYTIPIVSESTGGKLLRKITFNTENGECALIKVRYREEQNER